MLHLWERNRLAAIYLHYKPWTRWILKPVLAADLLALALPKPASLRPDGVPNATPPAPVPKAQRREQRRAIGRALLDSLARNRALAAKAAEMEKLRKVPEAQVTRAMTARLTPFNEGMQGRINRFSMAWCRAFGIVTVETAKGDAQ
jgi:hypothetical protein